MKINKNATFDGVCSCHSLEWCKIGEAERFPHRRVLKEYIDNRFHEVMF